MQIRNMWLVVEIMVPFWSLVQGGTLYLGDPKGEHNFDDQPDTFVPGGTEQPSCGQGRTDIQKDIYSQKVHLECNDGIWSPKSHTIYGL